jgi:hypothetical protein
MVQIIYSHVLYLHPSGKSKVRVIAMDAEGPQLTLSSIMTSFEKLGGNEKISYEKLLDDVRRETFNPDRICFLDEEMEPRKVAQHFQVLRNHIFTYTQVEYLLYEFGFWTFVLFKL